MKTFMSKIMVDGLRFVVPFMLGAFMYSYYGGFGLMAGVVGIMLLGFITFVWDKRDKKSKKLKGGK